MTDPSLTETEKKLLKWNDPGDTSDTCDLIPKHFTETQVAFSDWPDAANEGVRLYGLMFQEHIEPFSPLDGLFSGVAAAAYCLAIQQVAEQLGVTEFAVRCALETDRRNDADGFVRECKQIRQAPNDS